MEKTLNLNGTWSLAGRVEARDAAPCIFHDAPISTQNATVPGNIELELYKLGLEGEPYFGTNSNAYRAYECYEWCYERTFEWDGADGEYDLVFEGVDCYGTVYLNGVCLGECHNAYIPAIFDASKALKKGENTLSVHIASSVNAFRFAPLVPMTTTLALFGMEHTRVRRPAHSWGWDICPRLALGGIFRGVMLKERPATRIVDWSLFTGEITDGIAHLRAHLKIDIARPAFSGYALTVRGVCGESVFEKTMEPWSSQVYMNIPVENPLLWWPRHYGAQNLYHVSIVLRNETTGQECDRRDFEFGIRTVALDMKAVPTPSPNPDFQFIINGVPIRAFGLNHVPCDALHSRDAERAPRILALATEIDANILRIWGGGIPEQDEFYSICDREGILIWHDFMYGCAIYPTDEAFLHEAEREAIEILRARRHHACIVLWAGDNECDTAPFYTYGRYLNPNDFVLTRKLLPHICRLYAPSTPYLPSSPYVSPESLKICLESGAQDPGTLSPEQHIWGGHEFFKSKFYQTDASYVSETGYFGIPSVTSLKKFLSPECLWPWDNEEWYLHGCNPFKPDTAYDYRIRLLPKLIREFFGETPDNITDFAIASQLCQAEAVKYFIERARLSRKMSGMTLWNLIDAWPHFSDAVVDYYFDRKIAFWYCRRSFAAFLISAEEPADWHRRFCYCNDTNETQRGHYVIREFQGGILSEGDFTAPPRSHGLLFNQETPALEHALFLIEWTLEDGTRGCNHVLAGLPRYSYVDYRDKWLPAIAELDHSFDAATIAR